MPIGHDIPLFIGIGNEFRQDDAVGLWMVRQLKQTWKEGLAEYAEACGEGTELMDLWQRANHVVVFDALMNQGQPGRCVHLVAEREHFPADFFKYSSHAFSLAEAVELSRVLGQLPQRLEVYAVEGERFGYGQSLSAPVLAGCQKLLAEISDDFFSWSLYKG